MATYETAETKYITVDGVKYAYRLFGTEQGIPLFLHNHFRGNMDWWDPTLINPLAAKRPILLVDNAGVGRSEGQIPPTYKGWAEVIAKVVKALKIPKIDVLGFSMGGFVAQMIALDYPKLVRKLIVAGAGPSYGEGVVGGDPQWFTLVASGQTEEDGRHAMKQTFFSHSDKKQQKAEEWWQRMARSRSDRAPLLSVEKGQEQAAAVMRWFNPEHADESSYNRLSEIRIPVLVANGSNDLLVPTHNSYVLFTRLAPHTDVHLHLYPDSGHGFLDEYAEHFSNLVNSFLDEKE